MLNSFNRIFDYYDYEKKLRHYFADSAPISADITIGLREINVSCRTGGAVSCEVDDKLSVAENVKKIIDACIESVYPKMFFSEKVTVPFTDTQKKYLLMQGLSIEQIHEKEQKRHCVYFTIVRFNEHGSAIDYVDVNAGTRFRAHLYKPLMLVKDKIWELASCDREGSEALYRYLMSISKQEVLSGRDAEDECGIQESL
jgi:hypothetical protein